MVTKIEIKRLLKNVRDSILYSFYQKKHSPRYIRKIVFVCKGNICRSAFAEHLMRAESKNRSISIESGGLNVDPTTKPPNEAVATATNLGVDLDGHSQKGWNTAMLKMPT